MSRDLDLLVEEVETLEAPSWSDFWTGVGIGIALYALT